MKTNSVMLASSLLSFAFASPAVFERAACNANNCARAVTGTAMGAATRSAHLADCSSFMACTVTPAASTVTTTVTPATVFIPTSTEVDVYTSTAVVTAAAGAGAGKRQVGSAVTRCGSTVPAYASACSGAAAFSSACSCAGVTKTTTTVAQPTSTVTVTSASTTVYGVSTISSEVVATVTAPPPTCTTFNEVLQGPDEPITYRQYYSGTGTTEDTSNPGNRDGDPTPITETYGGTLPKCSAAASCASYAAIANYYSFDLHYLKNKKSWECKLYFNNNNNPSYFDKANSNVGEAYGYSI